MDKQSYHYRHDYDKLPCYSYNLVNGSEMFVYYNSGWWPVTVSILKLKDWGNIPVARFKVKKWKCISNRIL